MYTLVVIFFMNHYSVVVPGFDSYELCKGAAAELVSTKKDGTIARCLRTKVKP